MINKTIYTLGQIANDKLLHFFYGTILGFIFVIPFSWIGILLTLKVAIVIECIDFIRHDMWGNHYKVKEGLWDILFTTIPSILFYVITWIYQN